MKKNFYGSSRGGTSQAEALIVEPGQARACQNISPACFESQLFTNKSAKIRVRSTPIEKKNFLKSVSKHHSVLHYKKKSTSSAYVQERL